MAGVAVLVYDGDCGFCTSSARWLTRRARGRIDVTAWQAADLAGLGLSAEECATAVQLVSPAGRVCGGTAVSSALRLCPQPWRGVGAILGWSLLAPTVERAYRLVAAHRHRLPGSTCTVPDAASSHRDEGPLGGAVGQGPRPPVPPAQG